MNGRQLLKIGVPKDCVPAAIGAIHLLTTNEPESRKQLKQRLLEVVNQPDTFVDHPSMSELAKSLIAERDFVPADPVEYTTWGSDGIDQGSHEQMKQACRVPVAVGGALMPDAHVGYGLPIGGVLACENAVIPYAVGVDIACRMKLSVLDISIDHLNDKKSQLVEALETGTRFGIGACHEKRQQHDVMDQDWSVTRVTREKKDRAWNQLGTSGSGNHFVEFGVLSLDDRVEELQLDRGQYVALLSHSGSRGAGAAVCSTYSNIARSQLPKKYEELGRLAWLDLDTQEGQEYWLAMNLMGDYAKANHDVIHRLVSAKIGAEVISEVENHHNFAWKEHHSGQEVIVHRKGATPAGDGELGVIPGSMADPAFVVKGKGNRESLQSASHGAGRRMSRTQARDTFHWKSIREQLADRGVHVISAGADEVPGVYKNILDVMDQQSDLVDVIARFDPKVVKMCDDGSKPED